MILSLCNVRSKMAVKVNCVTFQLFIFCVILQQKCNSTITQKCLGNHEQYRTCGPPCPPICYDLIEKSACRKEDVCVKGCFCKHGFYRNDEGECVLPEDCFPEHETICKTPLETYDKCLANCQSTCENYGKQPRCPKNCKAGCVCNEGLVRNEEGNCIPPQFCKTIIGDPLDCGTSLEDFHYCRANCESTCQNFGTDLEDCEKDCKAGCICKEGLVRDENGQCIMPQYCKNLNMPEDFCGGLHEVFDCGSPCDRKCKTLREPCKKFSRQCVKKCYCQKGYARDHRNVCIPIRKCPQFSRSYLLYFQKMGQLKK